MKNQTELDQIKTVYSPKGSEFSLLPSIWIFVTTKNLKFHNNPMSELSVHSGAWLFSTIKLDADAEKTSHNNHTTSHTMIMKCWRRLDDKLLHLSQRHHHQFTSHLHFLSHHRLSCLAMPTDGPHRMAHLDDSLLPTTAITGYTTGNGSLRMAHLDDSLLPTTAITGYTTGLQKLSAHPSFDHCHYWLHCQSPGTAACFSLVLVQQQVCKKQSKLILSGISLKTAHNAYSKKPVKSQKNNLTDLLLIFFYFIWPGWGCPIFVCMPARWFHNRGT